MKYIGLVRTYDLPSTSIGLRVSEMAKLGFSQIILYAKSRTTVARQFRKGTVVSDEKRLRDEVARHGDCIVMIAARHIVDASGVKALGEPKEHECRCLTGQRLVDCVSVGSRSVFKAFEYDRRRGVARFDSGDSGDVNIDIPGDDGLMVMRSDDFLRMLEHGDSFISSGEGFQEAADLVGVSTICSDPISAGVSWHAGRIHDEKKPVNVVYGEKQPKGRAQVKNEGLEGVNKEEPTIPEQTTFPTPIVEEEKKNAEANETKPRNESKVEHGNGLPVLSVVFQTHNRTATACYCLDALCKRLRYSGRIHYCICDDRSDRGHVSTLIRTLYDNGISDYSVHVTTKKRWGLGASMNNGLAWSFKFTECVLTIEDDFLLRKEFDITSYVNELEKPDVAGIKLAANATRFSPVIKCGHDGFVKVVANKRMPRQHWYTFNNLVMLRHKRVFDEIGYYVENRPPETMEQDAMIRFNAKTNAGYSDSLKVLWPERLKLNTYDTEWFLHIGKSTMGHTAGTSTKAGYEWLGSRALDEKLRSEGSEWMKRPVHIIIPCYNNPGLLDRCLASIASQTKAASVLATVVDDVSRTSDTRKILDVVMKYPFATLMPLHDKGMAGGARNHAIINSPVESMYTMFVDSDDELLRADVIESIIDEIQNKSFPDVLCFGYADSYGKIHIPHATSENMNMFVAPWSRCTLTKKVQLFTEERRMCNDTIQYLKTIDSVDSVDTIPKALIRYHSDNPDSGWHNKTVLKSKDAIDAMALVMNEIAFEKFNKRITAEKAVKAIAFIRKAYDKCLNECIRGIIK